MPGHAYGQSGDGKEAAAAPARTDGPAAISAPASLEPQAEASSVDGTHATEAAGNMPKIWLSFSSISRGSA